MTLLGAASAAQAQQTTGTIVGRVYNPVTKEYVRDAEVRVQGTALTAITEAGGYYQLSQVPAGAVTVSVSYVGYPQSQAVVTLAPGGTATRDLELVPAADPAAAASKESVLKLEAFVVNSEREGNAKALQRQKESMTMSQSISSDAFGDVTEGNVGEFLKYLPGVELEYVEADTRGPRLGGMGSEYASVTMDGMGVASADAFTQYTAFENSAAGTSNRSFGFEQVSINSIDSIDVNRVTSPAMDANAPAGNIDLKTRRAFDLKGRRIGWNLSTVLNTEEFTLKRTVGPSDSYGRKFRPNYSLNYSDVFLNNRLGILVGISESNLYNEQYRVDHTYNRTPTAADPRPQVLTQILLKDGPKWTKRFTSSLTADFRATEFLTLSLSVIYNGYDARFYNRQVTMQASANNTGAATGRQNVGGDGVLAFGTMTTSGATSRQVVMGGGNGIKLSHTTTISPRFEYRRGNIQLDGAFSYSSAHNDYDNLVRGTAGNTLVNNLQNIQFSAARSGGGDADWHFTQTGGADWADLASYVNPRISDDNRKDDNDLTQGQLNARYNLPTRFPTFLRVGGKMTASHRITSSSNAYDVWRYAGPGGGATGTFAQFPSDFRLYGAGNQVGATFTSIGGGGAPAFPNRDMLGELFRSHPEYFVRGESEGIITTAQYEQGRYTNSPTFDVRETIPAAYLMANSRINKLRLQGGVRFEETRIESKDLMPRSRSEIVAAGYPVDASGNPTTWAGMDYKYANAPRVAREGRYHNYFPSMTAKYAFASNLLADIGWGKAIKRPPLQWIAGTRQVDDTNEVVTTPNPNLLPERSEKVVASMSYFFGRSGSSNLQVIGSYNKLVNQQVGRRLTAEEYGNTDPAYEGFEFQSFTNADTPTIFRSLEVSYLQQFTFLPRAFQGTALNLSFTRTKASRRTYGTVPNSVKGGLSYRYGRFNIALNGVWRDNSPWFQGTSNRYLVSNVKYDLSGGFRIREGLSFYFQGRNILEEPHRIFERSAGNPDVLYRLENYGTNWTFGLRGTF
ncbi:TonB-dependent receptor [Opitutus sp. ER46]|uniref:TonB-dependent receptor n=1 Tax=Opitutus sp. ER46 TaxID=2161864 RepID=UPI001304B79C|nr:TonB-dependent receptor [Opitutus sp. ER46]